MHLDAFRAEGCSRHSMIVLPGLGSFQYQQMRRHGYIAWYPEVSWHDQTQRWQPYAAMSASMNAKDIPPLPLSDCLSLLLFDPALHQAQ